MFKFRNIVCALMAVIYPAAVSNAQSGLATLYSQGGVRLNGASPPGVIAIFPDDEVQTEHGSMAKLAANGSSVTVGPESLVRFEGTYVVLEHGSVAVETSQAFAVRVGCLTVVPARIEGTQYDVTDSNGEVKVVARKSDVNIDRKNKEQSPKTASEDEHVTVREGTQETRQDHCGAAAPVSHAAVAGIKGPFLNSAWVKLGGSGAVAGLACWVLCQGDNPISPNTP